MRPMGGHFAGVGVFEGLLIVVWSLLMIGGLISYIIILVAIWRGMKAHESIAATLKDLTLNLKPKGGA